MKNIQVLIQNDFYKQSHYAMYPEGTTKVYSNLTPRKSRVEGVNYIVVFGPQYFIKEYLISQWHASFFSQPWEEVSKKYKRIVDNTLGKGTINLDHIKKLHDLGYLPLEIKVLPEGSICPVRVPCLTITNTVDHAYWLVNFLETILSCSVWQAITSATLAFDFRRTLTKYAAETGDLGFVPWQSHDFSHRGLSSLESACLSGAGHLLSFTGTDSIPAIEFLENYYNADVEKELVGASVPASEHSVICLGSKDGEIETFERLLDVFSNGILSMVSDTWSLPRVITEYLPRLKDKIKKRNGKLVIRPDSFWTDPVDCLCGFDGYHPQMDKLNPIEKQYIKKGLIEALWDIFGGAKNDKGYKVLNPSIGAIYGDSVVKSTAIQICERLKAKGFASTNVCLGTGSFFYQYNTRDTFSLAMKATFGVVADEERSIWKDPVTDDGMKKSAKGLLQVKLVNNEYVLKDQCTWAEEQDSELKTVFLNGKLTKDWTLKEIRDRLQSQL